ncbi:MAG: serine/threonine-protein kinase [Actinomycetota bacterium]
MTTGDVPPTADGTTWTTAGPPPVVPGYLIGARLGVGSSGSVWRATAASGGPQVAVKVLRTGPDTDRELAVLRAVSHPHVVHLHQGVVLDDGRVALVLDLVDGGTLASIVAQRGHLAPGEVVTVVASLAQALADLHADGVEHGDLAPGNVLFDRSGRPVLTDLGTTRLTGEPRDEVFGTAGYVDPVVLAGAPPGPASDVYGLGALAWLALTGAPPETAALRVPLADLAPAAPAALIEAVEAAVDPDPARRPGPAALASALHAACEPVAVWLPGAGPEVGGLTHRIRQLAAAEPQQPPATRRHRVRRPTRRRFAAAAGLAVVAGVVATCWWVWPTRSGGASAASAPRAGSAAAAPARAVAPTPSVPDAAAIRALVADLSGRRARLFADPRRPASEVAVPGSPAEVEDEAALRALRERGLAYRGLLLQPGGVRVVDAGPRRVVVDLATAATAYDVVDRAGTVVTHALADPGRRVRLVLSLTTRGWRVQAVLAA